MKSKIKTLHDVVKYVKKESDDPIAELLMMGFTPCQLVYEFGFDKNEVKASEVYDDYEDEVLDETEYPFSSEKFTSFDLSLAKRFQLNEDSLLVLKKSYTYKEMFAEYTANKEEAKREIENMVFDNFEGKIYGALKDSLNDTSNEIKNETGTFAPYGITEEIKKLGFGHLICTSFEEAERNNRKKNIVVIDNSDVYLTFKYNNKFGELVAWGEDEFKEDENAFPAMIKSVKEIYSLTDDEIATRIKDNRFLLIFAEY